MKIKSSELKDHALDWAVATCQNVECDRQNRPIWFDDEDQRADYTPSTDPAQAYPIIDREGITVSKYAKELEQPLDKLWFANTWDSDVNMDNVVEGPTPLIAAMRCYVASKLGDEVDVPEELL